MKYCQELDVVCLCSLRGSCTGHTKKKPLPRAEASKTRTATNPLIDGQHRSTLMRRAGSGRAGDEDPVISSQCPAGRIGADAGGSATWQEHDDAENQAEKHSHEPAALASCADPQAHQAQASDRKPGCIERAAP